MRLRRTLLYVPGNSPARIQAAAVCDADVVVLDLEDAVAPAEKDAARTLVSEALRFLPWDKVEVGVRINPPSTELGIRDLEAVVPAGARLIRVPKCESMGDLAHLDQVLGRIEKEHRIAPNSVRVIASIETAKGLIMAPQIAMTSERLDALSLGGEDLTADLGAVRSKEGDELTHARMALLAAARAANLDAIDTVFSDVNDDEGLFREASKARRLGFDGKSVISPRQIPIVLEAFRPSPQEVAQATKIVAAARDAESRGSAVVSVDGRMVDLPVVRRAQKILAMARSHEGR